MQVKIKDVSSREGHEVGQRTRREGAMTHIWSMGDGEDTEFTNQKGQQLWANRKSLFCS